MSHCGQKIEFTRLTRIVDKRDLHTLKGSARLFSLADVANSLHRLEESLKEVAESQQPSIQFDNGNACANAFWQHCADLDSLMEAYQQTIHSALPERRPSHKAEHAHIAGILEEARTLDEARSRIFNEVFPNLKLLADAVVTGTKSAAVERGIPQLSCRYTGPVVPLLDAQLAEALEVFLIHAVNNAVAHSLQPGRTGQLVLTVSAFGREIRLSDSGLGLDLAALQKKGLSLGLITESASAQEIAELVFHDGLSTSQGLSQLSGRGIGMSAVRSAIERIGGRITVEFIDEPDADRQARHNFSWVIHLPAAVSKLTAA